MLKFLHTANYFYYQASERLENKISKINSAIDEFQSQYPTKLRMISNNQIAIDNRKQLTQVRKKTLPKEIQVIFLIHLLKKSLTIVVQLMNSLIF